MRRAALAVFAALLAAPAVQAADCAKPASSMTPDEYVACVSLGQAKRQMEIEGRNAGTSAPEGPTRRAIGAGQGVSATAGTRDAACARATARAGNRARGACDCAPASGGRWTCTVDVPLEAAP